MALFVYTIGDKLKPYPGERTRALLNIRKAIASKHQVSQTQQKVRFNFKNSFFTLSPSSTHSLDLIQQDVMWKAAIAKDYREAIKAELNLLKDEGFLVKSSSSERSSVASTSKPKKKKKTT